MNFSVKAKLTLLTPWASFTEPCDCDPHLKWVWWCSFAAYVTIIITIFLQVLLFKNGQPILRVERGTTLSVIKLLYQADPRNKGTVIALRPDTDDPLPCVLTLDQSPLEEAKYEIITHGEYTLSFIWSWNLLNSKSSLMFILITN